MPDKKTAIVTGAAGGIGGGLVAGFLQRGYNVVGTSLECDASIDCCAQLDSRGWRYRQAGDCGEDGGSRDQAFLLYLMRR